MDITKYNTTKTKSTSILIVWLGLFILWHVNFRVLFNAKTVLVDNSSTIQPIAAYF